MQSLEALRVSILHACIKYLLNYLVCRSIAIVVIPQNGSKVNKIPLFFTQRCTLSAIHPAGRSSFTTLLIGIDVFLLLLQHYKMHSSSCSYAFRLVQVLLKDSLSCFLRAKYLCAFLRDFFPFFVSVY